MSNIEFIKAEDITFSWGSTEILHKVSMSAGNGAFVGVIRFQRKRKKYLPEMRVPDLGAEWRSDLD